MVPGIADAKAYREKVEVDLAAFMAEIDNAYLAVNAWTFAYHLHEWLWAGILKSMTPPRVRGQVLRKKKDFADWLEHNCPHFNLIQALTNGSKHAIPVAAGGPISGFGKGPFGIGPYGQSYLLIDNGEQAGIDRYMTASRVVNEMANFMIDLSKELGA